MAVGSQDLIDDRLQRLLLNSGYQETQLRRDENVWTPRGNVRSPLVCFARDHGPFDTSTATIVAGSTTDSGRAVMEERLTDAAISLAAPVLLLSDGNGVTLCSISANGDWLFARHYDWTEAYAGLPKSLNPRTLLQAKLGERQGSLFPIDAALLTRARNRTESALGPRIARLLDAAGDVLAAQPGKDGRAARHARAARLVIGALTAVVLRDKESGGTHGPDSLSGGALFDTAMQRHPAQFEWARDLAVWESDVLDLLVDELSDVDFSFAEPILLSRIYESRLVDDAARRHLGAHYTPPALADQILRYLPIEELPPDSRRVLDPTSGSGTLLLAAHDRLAALQPRYLAPAELHRELVTRLHGTDIDPVAVEIANLSLLLHALPAGNGWQVSEGDALHPHPRSKFDIVVANPPWKWSNRGSVDDIAHIFLERMLHRLRPDGLLGVVLPVAWLTRRTSRASRDLVRRQCDLFEAWRLPPGTFEGAASGAAVLLARRKAARAKGLPLIFREVTQSRDLDAFYRSGYCGVALSLEPSDEALASGPLSRWWINSRGGGYTVGDYAATLSGPQPASLDEQKERGVLEVECNAKFIPEPGEIERFARVQAHHLVPIAFPKGMQQGSRRGAGGLNRRKVLVGAAMSPSNPWRLRVALDETGALPRNTATMVLPHHKKVPGDLSEDDILYGLLAFLGSGFASAFIADTIQTRKIGSPQIRALPAPDPDVLTKLALLGRALADASTQGDYAQVKFLRAALDQEVWEWSGIPDRLRDELVARLYPDTGEREHFIQLPETLPVTAWRRTGTVVALDGAKGLCLAVPGFTSDDGEWVGVPLRFPGAAARLGASFVARLPNGESLTEAEFSFDELAYMADEEVVETILREADKSEEEYALGQAN